MLQLRLESQEREEQARVRRRGDYHPVGRLAISVIEATQQAAGGSVGAVGWAIRIRANDSRVVWCDTTICLLESR